MKQSQQYYNNMKSAHLSSWEAYLFTIVNICSYLSKAVPYFLSHVKKAGTAFNAFSYSWLNHSSIQYCILPSVCFGSLQLAQSVAIGDSMWVFEILLHTQICKIWKHMQYWECIQSHANHYLPCVCWLCISWVCLGHFLQILQMRYLCTAMGIV